MGREVSGSLRVGRGVLVYVFNNAGDWDVVGSIIETAWGNTISEEGEIGSTRERGQLASSGSR